MATAFVPEEFIEFIEPLLPPDEPVGPQGGRPRVLNKVAVRVIWYVLATGIRWHDVLPDMGCSGRTAHRRLVEWQRAGVWDALHSKLYGSSDCGPHVDRILQSFGRRGIPVGCSQPGVRQEAMVAAKSLGILR